MSFHIVSIDSPQCLLSCRDGQLTCKTAEGERKLPLEDVASIIVTSFSASIHSQLFLEAAKHGVALIICEAFKPVSLVLPANRATDTLLSRAIISLKPAVKQNLWQRTVDAKCRNQFLLAEHLVTTEGREQVPESCRSRGDEDHTAEKSEPPHVGSYNPQLASLVKEFQCMETGHRPHKEAICAKMFWQVFGRSLQQDEFTRKRAGGGLNDLLNYGYAVLLSTVLQKIFAVGLDPTFGISHEIRERSTPLAYDLMEPFRPCVDWRVIQWVKQHPQSLGWEVTKEYRKWVTGFPLERVDYLDFELEIQGCIEGVVRSFRRAVMDNSPRYYRPWTMKNGKWAA